MHPGDKVPLVHLRIATPAGEFHATYLTKGLAQLHFPTARPTRLWLSNNGAPPFVRSWQRATKAALKAILAGRAPRVFPPLDLSAGTPFQKAVWRALKEIPTGQTKSYGEIARAIGKPKAVRAVGSTCGANPIPVFVPCHRALAAQRKLGGFSGGLDGKRRLLEREGARFC